MPSDELLHAYCRTDYRVDLPNRYFSIHPGRTSIAMDDLLQSAGQSSGSLITADNPRSEQLPDADNADRRKALRRRLERGGWSLLPTTAHCPESTWPAEHGLLVPGLSERDALALAADFDQHAIVCVSSGSRAVLRFVVPTLWKPVLTRGRQSEDPIVRWVSREAFAHHFGN